MKNAWFKKITWFYQPCRWQGWLIIVLLLIFCIHIFIFIDQKSHSISDTFYGIFPYIVPTFLIYLWLGAENSQK